jgi:hypothetical protein
MILNIFAILGGLACVYFAIAFYLLGLRLLHKQARHMCLESIPAHKIVWASLFWPFYKNFPKIIWRASTLSD